MDLKETDNQSITVPVINPIMNPDAPYLFICSGTTLGTTPMSIRCRQKSPQSIQRKTLESWPRL